MCMHLPHNVMLSYSDVVVIESKYVESKHQLFSFMDSILFQQYWVPSYLQTSNINLI